jgi:ribonuclease D
MPSGRNDFRSRHRQRAHDEAHADDNASHELKIPEGLQAPSNKADLVTEDAALAELLAELREAGSFAYDSEFIGESSYNPRLCLIQVATVDRVSLIDPMASLDLAPFWELLCDPSVEKIVHAGAQDIEPVARFTGKAPRNLLDTQIAAGFVAMAYPTSLAKLVAELTGVPLAKGLTFTHWDQRPLSAKQLRYAADDVRYLPAVMIELKKRLDATGHLDWVRAECDALCEPSQYKFDPEQAVEKVRGAGSLEARQLNVLKELVIWRDAAAREADLPARSYLRDEVLIDIVRAMPKKHDQFSRVRGMPRPVIERHAETIFALVARGAAASVEGIESLRGHEPTPSQRFAADALWAAAQTICLSQSIDPAVVTSRNEIGELHRHLMAGTDPGELRVMTGWRKQALGDRLVSVYRGESTATISLPRAKK